jgi:SAM-dependent methyltransferase
VAEGNPDFYGETLDRLLRSGVLDREMRILVLCGGKTDRTVLLQRGFTDVTITNVDPRPRPKAFAPYQWSYQDAEHLTYEDESFDFCIVHSGLHHCHSPHRALLEMYRVARHGLLLFEPYDNLLTRLGLRFGLGQEYEHASVYYNGGRYGGVANTAIPNFVYRWTGPEIVKTINCFAPTARHDIQFFHAMRIPWGQLRARRRRALYYAVRLAQPALHLLGRCFPRQSNNFAALVRKPDLPQALHPWLRQRDGAIELNLDWLGARYGPPAGRQRAASPERSPARAPGVG